MTQWAVFIYICSHNKKESDLERLRGMGYRRGYRGRIGKGKSDVNIL